MEDMFEKQYEERKNQGAPLATRMRPSGLQDFVGQEHIVGKGRVLRKAIETGQIPSMILYGPPGSGKTTLARIIANSSSAYFSQISAVSAGVNDLRRVFGEAEDRRKTSGQKTILFIDEIHRFNKSQQDAILPFVEDGTIILIGATTENPSFEVTSPLLSRCRVFPLKPLSVEEMTVVIMRALRDKLRGLGDLQVEINEEGLNHLITVSNNDARVALNALEMAAMTTVPGEGGRRKLNLASIEGAVQHRAIRYDRAGEQHYDLISALHKSMRGSDPDASLYWLAKMLEAGEDPMYIARRVVRFASEDVGMADPQALVIAMAAQQAVHFVGMPEANLALAQAVVYLATAPKSNSLYEAYARAQKEISSGADQEVPLHLRNPVTPLMKEMEYGKDYKYAHDFPGHIPPKQDHLPKALKDKKFYTPSNQGYEQQVLDRLKAWWEMRKGGDEKDKQP